MKSMQYLGRPRLYPAIGIEGKVFVTNEIVELSDSMVKRLLEAEKDVPLNKRIWKLIPDTKKEKGDGEQ